MQRIEVFQSLWAMTTRPPDGVEMPLHEQLRKISAAKFDGVDIVYGDYGERELSDLLTRYGLACTVTGFPKSIEGLKPALELASNLGARHLNIIGQVYPFDISEGANYVRGWLEMCDRAGMPVTIETHRDCITTDMHYCLQLMEAVPEMRLCADLSHYVVGREFGWPIDDRVQAQVEAILDRSDAFQGRVASREQIQLQISFEHHSEWFEQFAKWWTYGFSSWKARNAANDATLNFLCELGPREYAMTGADGKELSDRWQEALTIRDRVLEIWKQS